MGYMGILLAPSPCKSAKSASSSEPKFTGPRRISRIFEGLEVREVLVPSALLRFGKMQKFAFVRDPALAEPDSVSSSSAAYDFHEMLRAPVSLYGLKKHHAHLSIHSCFDECTDQSIHAQTIIPFVFQEHTLTGASMPKP